MKSAISIGILLILLILLMAGCSSKNPSQNDAEWHMYLGQSYAAKGRYELAKEHLLMALAANDIPERRDAIFRELKNVDTYILTQR
ncbi:hypothetical protein LJC46_03610 [Desulfovibrio sp. OttesenSCG-928-G15]|nr:hypothetical protein [Desulfovibrio sp. OttesenSCG-928-G15]